MSVSMEVTIDDAEVKNLLQQLGDRARDLSRPMKLAGEHMRFSIEQNFAEGGRPTKWPVSARAKRDSGQTLVDTNRLQSSITYAVGKDSLTIGTNLIYGRVHQLGINRMVPVGDHLRLIKQAFGKKLKFPVWVNVERHARHMQLPARPFLVLQDEDKEEIKFIIRDYLIGLKGD